MSILSYPIFFEAVSMNHKKFPQVGHLIFFILVALAFYILIFSANYNEVIKSFALSILLIMTGIWGQIAQMVLIRIPANEKTYKINNYIIILFGIGFLFYSIYLYYL